MTPFKIRLLGFLICGLIPSRLYAFSITSIGISSVTLSNVSRGLIVEMKEEFTSVYSIIGSVGTDTGQITITQAPPLPDQLQYDLLTPNRRFEIRIGNEIKSFYTRPAPAGELSPTQAFTEITCTTTRVRFMNSALPNLSNPSDPLNRTQYFLQLQKSASTNSVAFITSATEHPPRGEASDIIETNFPNLTEQTEYIAFARTYGRDPSSTTRFYTEMTYLGSFTTPACSPVIKVSSSAITVSENAGEVRLTLLRENGAQRRTTVTWKLISESAKAGIDFESIISSMTVFEAGETQKSITIGILDNTRVENDKTFRLQLTQADNATLGTPNETQITIQNDDQPALVTFRESIDDVIESDGPRYLWVNRGGNLAVGTTVQATLVAGAGTAIEGVDFTFTPQNVVFRPGDVEFPVIVQIKNNAVLDRQNPKWLRIRLTPLDTNAEINGNHEILLQIYDDEQTPTFEITQANYTVKENAQYVDVEIRQNHPLGPASVVLSVDPLQTTAIATSDYLNFSQRIQFSNGETSKTVRVTILNDLTEEPTEFIDLFLNTPTDDAQLGAQNRSRITILDNDGPGQTEDDIIIRQPAGATPVVNSQTQLNIIAETGLNGGIAYTWKQIAGVPGGALIESPNANTTTVRFTRTGFYTFQVTLQNVHSSLERRSTVIVEMPVIARAIEIQQPNSFIRVGDSPIFKAIVIDQFGDRQRGEPVFWLTNRFNAAKFLGDQLNTYIPSTVRVIARTINGVEAYLDVEIHPANAQLTNGQAHPYPNPWKSSMGVAEITFTSLADETTLTIYTSNGRVVKRYTSPNGDDILWPLLNEEGERVASGVYLYHLERPGEKHTGKLFVIK